MLHLELTSTGVRNVCEEKSDGAKLPSCMMVAQGEFGHVTWQVKTREQTRDIVVCVRRGHVRV
jgi:hypothetical protein